MPNFLHGVETIEIEQGSRPITVVKSAVIGLIGIAPNGPVNTPVLVAGDTDAAQFGKPIPGFDIPQALNAIFSQGAGTVIVVNVFDQVSHTIEVTDEVHAVADGALKLSAAPIGVVTIKDSGGEAVAFVEDEDYSIDEYGNFKVLSSDIANGTSLKFSFKKLDLTKVLNADIIGEVDGNDDRTGTKSWDLAFNLFGFNPKILIAPGFSDDEAIASALIACADKFRAIALIDAPAGSTVSEAIAGRGVSGEINFNTSSKRAFLLYPRLKAYDVATDSNIDFAYSSYMAGVIAATDNTDGFWFSPSNKEIKGIVGAERNISAGISDPTSEANRLNEVGITTIFNSFGTGIRTWGNRSAAFPASTFPDNFISVRRTADVLQESVEQASLQFVDRPINQALIDTIRESVNAFIRILVGRGALVDGYCKFDRNKNSTEQLAAGQLVFDITFMPPTPGERITFNSFIDLNLLKSLQ